MADEGLEPGDAAMAASAVNGPPSAADVDDQYQRDAYAKRFWLC
jgi:hypothetical protein